MPPPVASVGSRCMVLPLSISLLLVGSYCRLNCWAKGGAAYAAPFTTDRSRHPSLLIKAGTLTTDRGRHRIPSSLIESGSLGVSLLHFSLSSCRNSEKRSSKKKQQAKS